jgi:hypothetical protein
MQPEALTSPIVDDELATNDYVVSVMPGFEDRVEINVMRERLVRDRSELLSQSSCVYSGQGSHIVNGMKAKLESMEWPRSYTEEQLEGMASAGRRKDDIDSRVAEEQRVPTDFDEFRETQKVRPPVPLFGQQAFPTSGLDASPVAQRSTPDTHQPMTPPRVDRRDGVLSRTGSNQSGLAPGGAGSKGTSSKSDDDEAGAQTIKGMVKKCNRVGVLGGEKRGHAIGKLKALLQTLTVDDLDYTYGMVHHRLLVLAQEFHRGGGLVMAQEQYGELMLGLWVEKVDMVSSAKITTVDRFVKEFLLYIEH